MPSLLLSTLVPRFYEQVAGDINSTVKSWLASYSLELCIGADDHSYPDDGNLQLTVAAWDPVTQVVPDEIWQGGKATSL